MPFSLDHVLIWSRSFDEYQKIFSLQKEDYSKKMLGCADGASSFNAKAASIGINVVSCDPLYGKSISEIQEKISVSCDLIYPKILDSVDDFNWEYFKNPDALRRKRLMAANKFLKDYDSKNAKGRYVDARLPTLPFEDDSFDLALCGNFLFLYSEILSSEFHINSVLELLRISKEVRIFPLIGNDRRTPKQLNDVLDELSQRSVLYEIINLEYHFTKGANKMLQIYKK